MSECEIWPWFPIPFWDADTLSFAPEGPHGNDKMLVRELRTVLERSLDSFTAAIREKEQWWEKVNKSDVVERWRSEAAQQDIDDNAFNFALQQLRHQASQCSDFGVRPSPVPGVFESEQLLDTELQQQLLAALKPLEDVTDEDKDWHPGSDKQVLDVVHPSLFPLVYGLSRSTTAAKPPPPRNGLFSAATSSPSSGGGGWDPQLLFDEAAGLDEDTDLSDGASDGNDAYTDSDMDGTDSDGEPPERNEEEYPEADTGDDETDSFPNIGKRMETGAGQTPEERAAAADAVAAAITWHTPAFTTWKATMGSGAVVADPPPKSAFVSERFQWLPADVLVGADGRVVFDSYVNNMHPERHAALYAATVRLLERALPLFERTLAASAQLPQRVMKFERECEAWWQPDFDDWWEEMKESGEAATKLVEWRARRAADAAQVENPDAEPEQYSDEEMEFGEEKDALYLERRRWVPPTLPDTFEPPPPPPQVDLRRRRLQVIVKYADIVLTPEKPRYGGGVWHVEGMENEAIVASAIAYLAADNLSESRLHFRAMVTNPNLDYALGDDEGLQRMFGIVDGGRLNDPLGSVLCAPGRMLCWPNAFQHRVAPFELANPSRPGVRKIAILLLVDPRFRVISTRDVPPQQLAWHDEASQLGRLVPPAVKQKVDALREFPISLERANELRLELMEERKSGLKTNNHETFERKLLIYD